MESSQGKTEPQNNTGWWNTDMSLISHVREVDSQPHSQPQTPNGEQQKKWKPRDQSKEKESHQHFERKNFSHNTGTLNNNKEQKKKHHEKDNTNYEERTVTFAEDQESQTPKVYRPKQQTPIKSPSNASSKNWKGKSPGKSESGGENQNQNRRRSKSFNDNNSQSSYNSVPFNYDNINNKSQTPQPNQRKFKQNNEHDRPQSSNPIPIGARSAPPASKKSKPKSRSYEGFSSPLASQQNFKTGSPGTPQRTPNKPRPNQPGKSPRNDNNASTPSKKAKDRYPAHWTLEEVNQALKEGRAYKGNLRVNPHNSSEAYVTTIAAVDDALGINQPALDKDVYIQGMIARNRAFDGDVIIVELLPKSKWKVLKAMGEEKVDEIVDELLDDDIEVDLDKHAPAHKFLESVANNETPNVIEQEEEDDTEHDEDDSIQVLHHNDVPQKQDVISLDKSFGQMQISENTENRAKGAETIEEDELDDEDELQPSGRIVFIVESKRPAEYVGRMVPVKEDKVSPDDRFATFVPSDLRHPKMLVPISQVPDFYKDHKIYQQTLVVVKLANWRASSYFPLGKFDHILGQYGEIQAETEGLLLANNIDYHDFPQSIMKALPSGNYIIPDSEIQKRRDLRQHRIFTIDPTTAKDLDDALSINKLPDGNFQVGVHIADVSFFVQPGTELDIEAQKRSTSVYLVQKVIPMLPHILCENLCSLNPGVPRLAFSVMWTLSPQGDILDEWFGRTVISSCSKLSYDIAQLVIEGKLNDNWSDIKDMDLLQKYPHIGPVGPHSVHDIAQDIKYMWLIAKNLREKRYENGALSMNNVKLSFKLDEKGNPVTAQPYITKEANHMIEEFMLLANMRVARKIASTFPEASLLRNHAPPLDRKLQGFQTLCKKIGLAVDTSSAKSLGESLDSLKGKLSGNVFAAFQVLATKPMQLAKYFCTGTLPPSQWHHFALNVGYYTHFTRYPDVVVHRQLEAAIFLDKCLAENRIHDSSLKSCLSLLPEKAVLAELCQHCNDKKLDSRRAQEQSDKLFLALLLKTKLLFDEAVILSLGDKFITAIVPFLGSEKRIYMEDINAQSWKYNADNNTLSITWSSKCDASDLTSFPTFAKPNKSKTSKNKPTEATNNNNDQVIQKTFKVMDSLRVSMAATGSPLEVRVHIIHPSLWNQVTCPSFADLQLSQQ